MCDSVTSTVLTSWPSLTERGGCILYQHCRCVANGLPCAVSWSLPTMVVCDAGGVWPDHARRCSAVYFSCRHLKFPLQMSWAHGLRSGSLFPPILKASHTSKNHNLIICKASFSDGLWQIVNILYNQPFIWQ